MPPKPLIPNIGAEIFNVGDGVYANIKGHGWCVCDVLEVNPMDGKLKVKSREWGETVQVVPANAHNIYQGGFDPKDPDLFRVADLHLATLLHCLKDRYESLGQQYSKMGEMILSVNPFERMEYNSMTERINYLNAEDRCSAMQPHVWQIADKAYRNIVTRKQSNQSIVISGESGSGKTENTKTMIAFLGALSVRHSVNHTQKMIVDRVNENLRHSNPILESFGNAKTVRNDNSSRFGKYIKLVFEPQSGIMVGGAMVTYLLEKSRVVGVGEGERSYHVFYEMLAGLTPQEKADLELGNPSDYRLLSMGNTLTRRGIGSECNDLEEFKILCEAMDKMGIGAQERRAIWCVLAAILHLLDVQFTVDGNLKAQINPDTSVKLATACRLLCINADALTQCFLVKSRTKILTTLCTQREAENLRDAFCKALYMGVFDSLVRKINACIAPQVPVANSAYIGVLDIFGFENFQVNSFEQLCINFANEALQNHYNKFTFKNDAEECAQEGIACPLTEFPDNTPCLTMFDGGPNAGRGAIGIFPLLDEECYFKGGTTERFTAQTWEKLGGNEYFIKPRATTHDAFGVKHYASDVMYKTNDWLDKNSDPLKDDARAVMQQNAHEAREFLAQLFDTLDLTPSDGHGARTRTSVSKSFSAQLQSLRTELESTESHFVRCVKPNFKGAPRHVDSDYVTAQLESAGVLQTIALKRQGYPVRRPHEDFVRFFSGIATGEVAQLRREGRQKDAALALLRHYDQHAFQWKQPHYDSGHRKIFMKTYVWNSLERLLTVRNRMRLRRCKRHLVRWCDRYRARKAAEAEAKRKAHLAQQEANARQAEAQGVPAAHAQENVLRGEKLEWFNELADIFRAMDFEIVADVVRQLPTKEQSIRALTEMKAQSLDRKLEFNLRNLMDQFNVADNVRQAMEDAGVNTLEGLFNLTQEQLAQFGFAQNQAQAIYQEQLKQESDAVRNQRLGERLAIDPEDLRRAFDTDQGRTPSNVPPPQMQQRSLVPETQQRPPPIQNPNNAPPPPSYGQATATAQPQQPQQLPPNVEPFKVTSLINALGCSEAQAVDALVKANGDIGLAGSYVMEAASSPKTRPPPPSSRPQVNRPPPQASHFPVDTISPPRVGQPPSQPPPQKFHQPPPQQHQPQGQPYQYPPQQPQHYQQPPQQHPADFGAPLNYNQQQPPPQRPPAPVPSYPQQQAQLEGMGFSPDQVARALAQTNGDAQRAVEILFQ